MTHRTPDVLPATVLIAICMALALPMAAGSGVGVGVDQDRQGSLVVTDQHVTDDRPRTWEVEAHNDGSAPFTGRIRLDVLDETNATVFRTWSDTIQVEPGSFSAHRLAYYGPDRADNLTANLVLHHGTDRETVSFPFTTEQQDTTQGFDVSHAWTEQDTTALRVAAPEDVDAFYVSVDDRSTRRYAQTRVENRAGEHLVSLDYHPEVIDTDTAHVTVSSTDGNYHYTGEVELQRSTGMGDTVRRWIVLLRQNVPII